MIYSKPQETIWDNRIRSISQILGFESSRLDNSPTLKYSESKSKGILVIKNFSKSTVNPETSEVRNLSAKKRWEQLMRISAKSSRSQILELLRQEIPLYQRVWTWLLKNSQKTSPKLYNLRRAEFRSIAEGTTTVAEISRFHSVANLKELVKHPSIANVIGSFLLHREDISYSVAVYNIAATFYFYSQSNEMTTFSFLAHVCTSQLFVHFLAKDYKSMNESLEYICAELRKCCPSIVFINGHKNVKVECFVETWLQSFFFPICENGSPLKEVILGYLILEQFSKKAVSRVCQATIVSLARVLNQGNREKCIEVLNNPKLYMDECLFKDYLLQ